MEVEHDLLVAKGERGLAEALGLVHGNLVLGGDLHPEAREPLVRLVQQVREVELLRHREAEPRNDEPRHDQLGVFLHLPLELLEGPELRRDPFLEDLAGRLDRQAELDKALVDLRGDVFRRPLRRGRRRLGRRPDRRLHGGRGGGGGRRFWSRLDLGRFRRGGLLLLFLLLPKLEGHSAAS